MSGIDEIRMESCQVCIDTAIRRELSIENAVNQQYWTIRSCHGDTLAYYNPDEFRATKGGREDKVNPGSATRERIIDNPDWFVDSIHHFRCESCNDRIEEGHLEFEVMKNLVYEFITGDVFPRLGR